MSVSLPIYKRGEKFVLHIRVAGRQIKRTLATSDPAIARVRAIQLLSELLDHSLPNYSRPDSNWQQIQQSSSSIIDFEACGTTNAAVTTEQNHIESIPTVAPFQAQQLIRQGAVIPTVFVPRTPLVNREKFRLRVVFSN